MKTITLQDVSTNELISFLNENDPEDYAQWVGTRAGLEAAAESMIEEMGRCEIQFSNGTIEADDTHNNLFGE